MSVSAFPVPSLVEKFSEWSGLKKWAHEKRLNIAADNLQHEWALLPDVLKEDILLAAVSDPTLREKLSLETPEFGDTPEAQVDALRKRWDFMPAELKKEIFLAGIHDSKVLGHLKDAIPDLTTAYDTEYSFDTSGQPTSATVPRVAKGVRKDWAPPSDLINKTPRTQAMPTASRDISTGYSRH